MQKFILLLLACCLIAGCTQAGEGQLTKSLPVTPGSGSPVIIDATNPPDSAFTVPTSLPKGTYFVAERITTKANNTENTLEASGAMVTVP